MPAALDLITDIRTPCEWLQSHLTTGSSVRTIDLYEAESCLENLRRRRIGALSRARV